MNKQALYRIVALIVFALIAIKLFSVMRFFIGSLLTLAVICAIGYWALRKLRPRAG